MSRSGSSKPTAVALTTAVLSDEKTGDLHEVYQQLRAETPVVWSEDPPIWVLTKHHDIALVNKDTSTFSSLKGILPLEIGFEYDTPPTMMHTDPPEHTRLRRAVAQGFRPSRIKTLEPAVDDHVRALLKSVNPEQPFDVVKTLAAPLPLMVICDLVGLPSEDWELMWEWSDSVIPGASDMPAERKAELQAGLEQRLRTHIADTRLAVGNGDKGGDIVADLIEAEGDGIALSDEDIYILLNQLLVAGNETTRNLISGGLVALAERPGEWAKVRAAVQQGDHAALSQVIEEMLRFTTPVVGFMRTATEDTQISDQEIASGEHVLMLWASANRDETEFGATAQDLVVDRSPNGHLAFGFGAHFCVGAALARLEARVVLSELARRFPSLEIAGEVVESPSTVIAGLEKAILMGGS